MAKILQEHLVISVSRIHKDNENLENILNDDLASTLEEVVQGLVGDGAVVEIAKE